MKFTGKIRATMMLSIIMALTPMAMCTGVADSATNSIYPLAVGSQHSMVHPLAVASNHWDSSDLTLGKSCGRQFAEKAVRRDFWGMLRVGLFCPSTAYSY